MGDFIAYIVSELFFWREDYRFYKRKKARRDYEKEHNLPKKLLIHPGTKVLFFIAVIGTTFSVTLGPLIISYFKTTKTEEKITTIETILKKEKKDLGKYPTTLKTIERNNPIRKKITLDAWNTEFHYQQIENGENYILISKGKDGILNTEDDIKSQTTN